MKLCDWCDQPTPSDAHELCEKCARAQEIEASPGIIEPVREKKERSTLEKVVINDFMMTAKVIFAGALGLAMIAASLFGTCSVIVAANALMAPSVAFMALGFAVVGFGIAFFLYKGIRMMFNTQPKLIERKQLLPSKSPEPTNNVADVKPEYLDEKPESTRDNSKNQLGTSDGSQDK
jgi:hypothetical protein